MKLKTLHIGLAEPWESKPKGQLYGKVTFVTDRQETETTVEIGPQKCERIVEICAELIVETSRELAAALVADLTPALEHKPDLAIEPPAQEVEDDIPF